MVIMLSMLVPSVNARTWIYNSPREKRDMAVAYVVANHDTGVMPTDWDFVELEMTGWFRGYMVWESGCWTVKVYLFDRPAHVEVKYNDGKTSFRWLGEIRIFHEGVTELEYTYSFKRSVSKIYIAYDLWEFMLMPWETSNIAIGFNIDEAGAYTIQAWQNAVLVWTSPTQFVWHSKGLNLIYYVGGARFAPEGPITFILMKEGVIIDTYISP